MTNSLYIDFLKRILVFSGILGILAMAIWFSAPDGIVTPVLPFLLLFFLSVTLISYHLQIKSLKERFIKSVNMYMLLMAAKLILYSIVLVVYALTRRNDVVPFMAAFFILYICYTIFETVALLKIQKGTKA